MRRAFRATALSTLLLATTAAAAQSTALPSFEERTGWPLPQSGIYFDPSQPGVGFSFDVGLDGTLIGGFGAYGADGQSVFYSLQGRITRDGLPAADAGNVGLLRSPVYLSRRIGAPDARVITEAVPALGEAVVRFLEPRRLTVEIAGQRWNMQRMALTEDPAQWVAGRFLLLVEPRAQATLRWPVLAQVSIGEPLRLQALPGPADGVCGGSAGAVAEARFVTCETGCGAFQEWAGGRTARVLVWSNGDGTTWQLGRYVEGDAGLVPLEGVVQYTLSPSPLSLDALPQARGCREPGEPLRFYRQPVPPVLVDSPFGPVEVSDALSTMRAGTWWDPSRPGAGLVLDVGGRLTTLNATAMAGVFDFRGDGSADFSTAQGTLFSGSPGMQLPFVLDSPLYAHRDGQCVGCAWRPPVTTAGATRLAIAVGNTRTDLVVTRTDADGVSTRRQLQRFEIDRSLPDEVRGRFLLRVDDPTFPANGGPGAPAFFAEVAIEPVAAGFDRSEMFRGGRAYALRCIAGCTEYADWLRSGVPPGDTTPREAVLWFGTVPSGSPTTVGTELVTGWARLTIVARNQANLVPTSTSREYVLDMLQRNRIRSLGTGSRGNPPELQRVGTVDLYRNPPRVLAD